jgi:hypothetical protein
MVSAPTVLTPSVARDLRERLMPTDYRFGIAGPPQLLMLSVRFYHDPNAAAGCRTAEIRIAGRGILRLSGTSLLRNQVVMMSFPV